MLNIVLIPAYKPDQRLVSLIRDLSKYEHLSFLVINNGNKKEYLNYFESISIFKKVSILDIKSNKGKGFGIKKGLQYIESNLKNIQNIIFADADGQHLPEDINNITLKMQKFHEQNLLLVGNRQHNKLTPIKNLLANKFFNFFFKKKIKLQINDSLCGLRAIKKNDINLCKNLKYNDFRFEVEMLMAYQIRNLRIYEQDIKSIYFRGTKSTLSIADVLRLIQILFFFKIEIK